MMGKSALGMAWLSWSVIPDDRDQGLDFTLDFSMATD
jgi:hypothetical protein